MDQYKIGTTTNSCSTMHKLTSSPITFDCFSFDNTDEFSPYIVDTFEQIVQDCEMLRLDYLKINR